MVQPSTADPQLVVRNREVAAAFDLLPQQRNARAEKLLDTFHGDHFNLLLATTAPGKNRMPAHSHNPLDFRFRHRSLAYAHLFTSMRTLLARSFSDTLHIWSAYSCKCPTLQPHLVGRS